MCGFDIAQRASSRALSAFTKSTPGSSRLSMCLGLSIIDPKGDLDIGTAEDFRSSGEEYVREN